MTSHSGVKSRNYKEETAACHWRTGSIRRISSTSEQAARRAVNPGIGAAAPPLRRLPVPDAILERPEISTLMVDQQAGKIAAELPAVGSRLTAQAQECQW